MRFRKINQFETRRNDHRLYLCHLQRGMSDLLVGLDICFEGFDFSRNSLLINFLTAIKTGCCSCASSPGKQWMMYWNLASSICSNPDCLQTVLPVFLVESSEHNLLSHADVYKICFTLQIVLLSNVADTFLSSFLVETTESTKKLSHGYEKANIKWAWALDDSSTRGENPRDCTRL